MEPRCYECLSSDVAVKFIDQCGFEHYLCGPCDAGYQRLREKIKKMFDEAWEHT